MPANLEIEAKFRVTDPELLGVIRHISALAARYPLVNPDSVRNEDTYFDTDDLKLARHGKTLRVRAFPDRTQVTFKSSDQNKPGDLFQRTEIQSDANRLTADFSVLDPDALPDDVAAAVHAAIKRHDSLRPIVRLSQTRETRDIARADASDVLGELSIDHVDVFRPAGEHDWQSAGGFDAVELEGAEDVTAGELEPLAEELGRVPGLSPDSLNKVQRALLMVNASAAGDTTDLHRQHVAELCRTVWRDQLAIMILNEAGVRDSSDIEYVHVMRVATRRARAAARLYASFFKRDSKRIRRFERSLRSTGKLLGAVRDLDVQIDKLNKYRQADESSGLGDDPLADARPEDDGIAALAVEWQKQREKAHTALLKWLDSRKYSRFVAEFRTFCASPGQSVPVWKPEPGVAPTPHQVRHVLPSMILARYESIRAFEVVFEDDAPVPVETIHALRIECKYLRYHLEFNSDLLGPEGDEMVDHLKALQEDLGQLNDAAVATRMLADAARPGASEGIDAYRRTQEETVRLYKVEVPGDLAKFSSIETRRLLALAVARI